MKEVYLTDNNLSWDNAKDYFLTVSQWASAYCTEYHGYRIQDVTDVTYEYDQIACYKFGTDVDVLLFSLKWK